MVPRVRVIQWVPVRSTVQAIILGEINGHASIKEVFKQSQLVEGIDVALGDIFDNALVREHCAGAIDGGCPRAQIEQRLRSSLSNSHL